MLTVMYTYYILYEKAINNLSPGILYDDGPPGEPGVYKQHVGVIPDGERRVLHARQNVQPTVPANCLHHHSFTQSITSKE